MAVSWNYNASEGEAPRFENITPGKHRVLIDKVVPQQSSKGIDQYKVILSVCGFDRQIWYYITFDPANSKMVNRTLHDIWMSFNIPVGNLEPSAWEKRRGAAMLKEEEYNGYKNAKVSYFIPSDDPELTDVWPDAPVSASPLNKDDLPF